MTKNGFDIQTISIKWTDIQADRLLPFGQVTEKKEKAYPSHFLKFLFADPHCTHLVLPLYASQPFTKPKEPFFANASKDYKIIKSDNLLKRNVQYITPFHLGFIYLTH